MEVLRRKQKPAGAFFDDNDGSQLHRVRTGGVDIDSIIAVQGFLEESLTKSLVASIEHDEDDDLDGNDSEIEDEESENDYDDDDKDEDFTDDTIYLSIFLRV